VRISTPEADSGVSGPGDSILLAPWLRRQGRMGA
jgi:hypothetical protein